MQSPNFAVRNPFRVSQHHAFRTGHDSVDSLPFASAPLIQESRRRNIKKLFQSAKDYQSLWLSREASPIHFALLVFSCGDTHLDTVR